MSDAAKEKADAWLYDHGSTITRSELAQMLDAFAAEQTAALEQQIETLRKEFEESNLEELAHADRCRAEAAALREENARLRGALRKYSVHLGSCMRHYIETGRVVACSCGLDDALLADPEGQAHEDSIMRLSREIEAGKADNMVLKQEREQADRLAAHQTARLSLEISNKRALAQAVRDYIVIPSDLPQEEQLARLRELSKCADAALDPEGQRAGEEWRARERAISELADGMKRLRQWLAEAIFHLMRAYEAGHRKGWEPGPSSTETLTLIHAWLSDKGFDPNERHTPQFVGVILSALGGDQTLAAVEKARQP